MSLRTNAPYKPANFPPLREIEAPFVIKNQGPPWQSARNQEKELELALTWKNTCRLKVDPYSPVPDPAHSFLCQLAFALLPETAELQGRRRAEPLAARPEARFGVGVLPGRGDPDERFSEARVAAQVADCQVPAFEIQIKSNLGTCRVGNPTGLVLEKKK